MYIVSQLTDFKFLNCNITPLKVIKHSTKNQKNETAIKSTRKKCLFCKKSHFVFHTIKKQWFMELFSRYSANIFLWSHTNQPLWKFPYLVQKLWVQFMLSLGWQMQSIIHIYFHFQYSTGRSIECISISLRLMHYNFYNKLHFFTKIDFTFAPAFT